MTEKCVQSCAAYGKVCPCAARIAAHAACDAINELKEGSLIFPQNEKDEECIKPNFTYLNADDIVIGKKLGEGGFSNVNLCTIKTGVDAGKQFAVKYLKKKAMVDLHQFKHGAADLAVEALYVPNDLAFFYNHPCCQQVPILWSGMVISVGYLTIFFFFALL
jgi:hypothetical protein